MKLGLLYSLLLHTMVGIAAIFGIPTLSRDVMIRDNAIVVDLVPVGEITNLKLTPNSQKIEVEKKEIQANPEEVTKKEKQTENKSKDTPTSKVQLTPQPPKPEQQLQQDIKSKKLDDKAQKQQEAVKPQQKQEKVEDKPLPLKKDKNEKEIQKKVEEKKVEQKEEKIDGKKDEKKEKIDETKKNKKDKDKKKRDEDFIAKIRVSLEEQKKPQDKKAAKEKQSVFESILNDGIKSESTMEYDPTKISGLEEARVKEKIRRMWYQVGFSGGKDIDMKVKIKFYLAKDGALTGEIVTEEDSAFKNNPYYRQFVMSTHRAIQMASPFNDVLSPEKYEVWKEFEVNFSSAEGVLN